MSYLIYFDYARQSAGVKIKIKSEITPDDARLSGADRVVQNSGIAQEQK